MKFVIASPRQTGGGPIVLYKLAKVLQEQGYDASVFNLDKPSDNRRIFYFHYLTSMIEEGIRSFRIKLFPYSDCAKRHYQGYVYIPVKGCRMKYVPWVDSDTVVVYPETVRGNPLHATNVVRWLLYFNQYPEDEHWYSSDDLFVSYREKFFNKKLNPNNNLLKIFHFDKELYRRVNEGERNGVCYIIRKGKHRKDLPSKYDGPILDDLTEVKKVEILNRCKICYLYDTQTTYAEIAALCGCIPIVVMESGKTKADYITVEDHSCGIAYGDSSEEISEAIRTRSEVIHRIDKKISENNENVLRFVELCRQHFDLN